MTKQELIRVVELAWQVATEADIGAGPMIMGVDQNGHPIVNTIRFNTYVNVLGTLLPKDVRVAEPREPWQE